MRTWSISRRRLRLRMSSSISSPLLLLSLPLLTVSTWTPKCDGTSEPKDLHGRSYALLHAHRLVILRKSIMFLPKYYIR